MKKKLVLIGVAAVLAGCSSARYAYHPPPAPRLTAAVMADSNDFPPVGVKDEWLSYEGFHTDATRSEKLGEGYETSGPEYTGGTLNSPALNLGGYGGYGGYGGFGGGYGAYGAYGGYRGYGGNIRYGGYGYGNFGGGYRNW